MSNAWKHAVKLSQTSVLTAVVLMLLCPHASAITLSGNYVRGGNVRLTAQWSPQRIPAVTPDIVSDELGHVTSVLEAYLDAWHPVASDGRPAAECPSRAGVEEDLDLLDAALWQTQSRGNTGSSPLGRGAAGQRIVFLSDCDTGLDFNQRQPTTRPEQSKWLNLSGILSGSNFISPHTAFSAVANSQRSSFVLIL